MLNYRKLLKFINRVIYISSAALLIAGSAMNVMAPPAPVEACNAQPVTICHGTGSATNPYTINTVDDNSIVFKNGGGNCITTGHGNHANDIIPTFTTEWGCSFAGKNLTTAGLAILNNGCCVPPQVPNPGTGPQCIDPPVCEWNPNLTPDDPACFQPCEWDASIPADDAACFQACEWDATIPADDPGCFQACEWDAAIPADSQDCKPPQGQFNLTSMCRPTTLTGSMRVRNQSTIDAAYVLYRVGGAESYSGTALAGTDTIIEVPWYSSSNTWKLEIMGYTITKAIGNNGWCEVCEWNSALPAGDPGCFEPCEWNASIPADSRDCKPPQNQFNLTSMCRPTTITGSLRVRNESTIDAAYLLYRYGGTESYTGTALAGTDTLVEVPWYSSSDTWKLEIMGYTITKAIGNNAWCEVCEWNTALPAGDPECVNDMCRNIEGFQEGIPEDMVQFDNNCYTDLCLNIEGYQDEVPDGYYRKDGNCSPYIHTPDDLIIEVDPYCVQVGGLDRMQWTIENPNVDPYTIDGWTLDGGPMQGGFSAQPGSHKFTTTPLGTHTITLYWGESQTTSLTWTIDSCGIEENVPLLVPVTGAGGEILIPVTGADLTPGMNNLTFGGFGMLGLGLILTGIRRKLEE